ncbi:hypothetical protein ACIBEA_16100 [Streptomyces sp. NPDC051555]
MRLWNGRPLDAADYLDDLGFWAFGVMRVMEVPVMRVSECWTSLS